MRSLQVWEPLSCGCSVLSRDEGFAESKAPRRRVGSQVCGSLWPPASRSHAQTSELSRARLPARERRGGGLAAQGCVLGACARLQLLGSFLWLSWNLPPGYPAAALTEGAWSQRRANLLKSSGSESAGSIWVQRMGAASCLKTHRVTDLLQPLHGVLLCCCLEICLATTGKGTKSKGRVGMQFPLGFILFFSRTDFQRGGSRLVGVGLWVLGVVFFVFPCRLVYWASVTRCQTSHYINLQVGTSLDLSTSPALQRLVCVEEAVLRQSRGFLAAARFAGNPHVDCSNKVNADLFPWMG